MDFNDRTGEKLPNYQGCIMEIIDYKNANNFTVRFEDGTIVKNNIMNNFKKGSIKNPNFPSVYNVGYFGQGVYRAKINGVFTKAYDKWVGMLRRCYSEKNKEKRSSYKDVTVCKEWHNFQVFAEWFEENYNPETMQGWHLDKDLLCPKCKIYSPETCEFVPNEINTLFINFFNREGETQGIKFAHNKYYVRAPSIEGRKHIKVCLTLEEAKNTYDVYKANHIQKIVENYKGKVSERIYEKLINYKNYEQHLQEKG